MSKQLPLVKYGPWSPSKAALADSCSLAFKYRYIDKLPTGPKGTPAKVGITVHRAQELLFKDHEVTAALDTAIAESAEELTHKETEQVRTFAQNLIEFGDRITKFGKNYPIKEILLENKWAMTADFEPCDFFDPRGVVRGVVDMGLVLENGHVIIIDHKTGKIRPAQYYLTQLHFYTVMALSQFPDLKGVQCALHYVAHGKLEWSDPVKPSYIRQVLRPWIIDYLNKKSERADSPEGKPGRQCTWCDYRNICTVWGPNGEAGKNDTEGGET